MPRQSTPTTPDLRLGVHTCVRYAAAALCVWRAAAAEPATFPAFVSPGKNYVADGDFSAGLGHAWKLFHRPARPDACAVRNEGPDGSPCFRISGTFNESIYLQQLLMPDRTSIVPGEIYTLSAWFKASNVSGTDPGKLLYFTNYGWHQGSVPIGVSGPTTDGWERRSATFRAPPTTYPPDSYKYALMFYWPKGTDGTVWLDNVQVERGPTATAFSALHNDGARLVAEQLRALYGKVAAASGNVRKRFADSALTPELLARCADLTRRLGRSMSRLTAADLDTGRLAGVGRDSAAIKAELGGLTCLVWTQDALLPARGGDLPGSLAALEPQALTCYVNETRNLGIMFSNISGRSIDYRIAPQRFVRQADGESVDGTRFITIREAPLIRGRLHAEELFTDPLPQCNEMNHLCVPGGETRQAVISIGTRRLEPGRYQGGVLLDALSGRDTLGRTLKLDLHVLPLRLPDRVPADVCPLGNSDLRAEEARRLGHNLMPLDGGALPVYLDGDGRVTRPPDSTQIDRQIRDCRAVVSDCRFVLLFSIGPRFLRTASQLHGWQWPEPKLKAGWQNWVSAVFRHFGELGLGAGDVYLQVVDEPQDSQVELMAELSRLAKAAVPGLKTMTYGGDPERHRALFEQLDLACPSSKALARDGLVAGVRATGTAVGLYDCREYNEINNPLCYRRLMPWKVWRHGLAGWHYWSRDDRHPNWEAVKYMSVLYPLTEGEFGRVLTPDVGVVVSRHWLALEAGCLDYKALVLLKSAVARAAAGGAEAATLREAEEFLRTAPDLALALNHPTEFPTRLAVDADPRLLDRLRERMALLSEQLLQGDMISLRVEPQLTADGVLTFAADRPCACRIDYVVDGALPRRELTVDALRERHEIALATFGGRRITSCRLVAHAGNGTVLVASPFARGRVSVDSTNTWYETGCLTDGIRYPGALFWPGKTWISGGEPVEHWAKIEWDEPRRIGNVVVSWMTRGGVPEAYKVQVRSAGVWEDVFDWRRAPAALDRVRFDAVEATGVRVVQRKGGGGIHAPGLMGISELEAY